LFFFFFKQKTAYEIHERLVGSEMCIRDSMRPIASHGHVITDFTIWRGLLVLSGVRADAAPDGHVFGGPDAKLWFGAIDDLWRLGPPRGLGGPWLDTPVAAGIPSDPCLLTGFARNELRLSHRSRGVVRIRIEIDVTADGVFHPYRTLTVECGETLTWVFPDGWMAHWLRLVPETATVATARLIQGPQVSSAGR